MIKIPKGFKIVKVLNQCGITFELHDKEFKKLPGRKYWGKTYKSYQVIGSIDLQRPGKDKNRYVTHSILDYKYHNRGLGLLMYMFAINYALKKGWKVSSSGNTSEAAQRLWKSKRLRKYFTIKRKKGIIPTFDKWYVYNKNV